MTNSDEQNHLTALPLFASFVPRPFPVRFSEFSGCLWLSLTRLLDLSVASCYSQNPMLPLSRLSSTPRGPRATQIDLGEVPHRET